jgi:hypothetical protein
MSVGEIQGPSWSRRVSGWERAAKDVREGGVEVAEKAAGKS